MKISQKTLRNLDETSKKMILNGVYFLFKTNLPDVEFVLKVSGIRYFGLDKNGLAIKEFVNSLNKDNILEPVFFDDDYENVAYMNLAMPFSI